MMDILGIIIAFGFGCICGFTPYVINQIGSDNHDLEARSPSDYEW